VFFQAFEELEIKKEDTKKALQFIKEYGLLPNDALILASCKKNNIEYLLSFDADFKKPARKEKIKLVKNIATLE
jgi:hypothetical protein